MRYAQMREMDISNGNGVGVALFVQGCPIHCEGCFNQSTWDFDGGYEWTEDAKKTFISLIDKPYVTRVSILGGEPLADQNVKEVMSLIREIKLTFPYKSVWLYTGYTLTGASVAELHYCDVIVDGSYEQDKRDLTLPFRGSSNQRVIDVKRSMETGFIERLY